MHACMAARAHLDLSVVEERCYCVRCVTGATSNLVLAFVFAVQTEFVSFGDGVDGVGMFMRRASIPCAVEHNQSRNQSHCVSYEEATLVGSAVSYSRRVWSHEQRDVATRRSETAQPAAHTACCTANYAETDSCCPHCPDTVKHAVTDPAVRLPDVVQDGACRLKRIVHRCCNHPGWA